MAERMKVLLEAALARLLAEDIAPGTPEGFPDTIGERPLVFRLAYYMIECGAETSGLKVDCDYNRHRTSIKELLPSKTEPGLPPDMVEGKPKRFFPDIVLHRRGDDEGNVLVCEIKRRGDHREAKIDRCRLERLTDKHGDFRYDLGAFIQIDQRKSTIAIEYFENGRVIGKQSLS